MKNRDIVLVTVDSLRADHVGCYGYERPTTPVIDELAGGGHRFSQAFAHACATRGSFPAILTSAYPLMYGGFERIASERTLISEALPGYLSGGYHSNLYLSADFGYERDFDAFFDSKTDPSLGARLKQFVRSTLDEEGKLFQLLASAVDTAEREVGLNVGSAYVRAEEMTDQALEWVEETRDADTPRFLWVHYMDVHHPYVPPKEHQAVFRDDPISEREAVQIRRKFVEEQSLPDAERKKAIDLYDAEIRYTDTEIGRLMEGIRDHWSSEPVVFLTADHGEAFGEHGRYSHPPTFYDEVMHVPLIADVGDEAGAVHEELVGLLDVAPTIVDYAGRDQPSNFYGFSLRPLIEDRPGAWDRTKVVGDWETDDERVYAVRTTDWKYITREGDVVEEELYDLGADPGEHTNIVTEYPEERDRFRQIVSDHKDLLSETATDLGSVEMDENVKARLRDLGYKE